MRLRRADAALVVIVLAIAAVLPCPAAEMAVLRNGFSIRHERRQVMGETTRLFVTADGASYVDVPTAEIDHIEAAPEQFSAAPPAQSAARQPSSGASVIPPVSLDDVVTAASGRFRLDPDLVNSVIKAESGFNVRAVSPKGAQGLMQLMPQTAQQLGVPNPFDPKANVEGGTRYLRELLELYNFDLVKALAAYNAGPQRVEQYGGVPPFYETRAYVARVVRDFNKKKDAQEKSAAETSSTKKDPVEAKSLSAQHAANAKPANTTTADAEASK